MGEHGQGDVPVPADVAADLVLVQAALVLRGLESLLDRPPGASDAHQFVHSDIQRCVAEVVGDLVRPGQAAPCQRPPTADQLAVLVGALGHWAKLDGRPVVLALPLRARAAGTAFPCLVRGLLEGPVDAWAGQGELGLGDGQGT